MSGNLRLNGGTSGYSELRAPDDAGDQVFIFPLTGGTLMTTDQVVSPDGLWTRSGSTLSPATSGDNITAVGNITAAGTITTEGNKVPGYQQGAWFPTFSDTSVVNTEAAYQSKFVRIGQTVFVSGRMLFTSINSSNSITITGLPYPAPLEVIDGSVYATSVMVQNQSAYISADGSCNNMSAFLSGSVNRIVIYWSSSTPTYRQVQWQDFNSTNSSGIIFNLHYQTPDTTWQPQNGATVS